MKFKRFFKSNARQLLEILLLIVILAVPLFIDTNELFSEYLKNTYATPENIIGYFAVSHGKWVVSIVVFFVLLYFVRRYNKDFVMNSQHVYHDYCYWWYWLCAKILGIRSCNLVLVPIYMQFMLVIRGTFEKYPLDKEDYPVIENEPECKITINNPESNQSEINIMLEDTYLIGVNQLPEEKRSLYTLHISRNDGIDTERHFSQKFIETVVNSVRKYHQINVVNVYATTNPETTLHLAKRAFGLGERGNIRHLYVFQQSAQGYRAFQPKGYKVY